MCSFKIVKKEKKNIFQKMYLFFGGPDPLRNTQVPTKTNQRISLFCKIFKEIKIGATVEEL